MKRLSALLLGLSFAPLLYAGAMDLTLPDESAEIKKSDDAPCKTCGVVTNVRQLSVAADRAPSAPDSPYLVTLGEASREPNGGVEGSGARINTWDEWPEGTWQTTVRYDDGSYATQESDSQPPFQKGDRVQLISGKLVPR